MALKTFKPVTPGLRQLVIVDRSDLYKGKPVKTLTEGKVQQGGGLGGLAGMAGQILTQASQGVGDAARQTGVQQKAGDVVGQVASHHPVRHQIGPNVAAAGNRGEIIHAAQPAAPRHFLKHSQAKRGAPNPAARKRQPQRQ